MEYQSADSMSTYGALHIAFALILSCLVVILYIQKDRVKIACFECALEEAHT